MAPEHDAPEATQHTVTTPQPSRLFEEPATVAACRADYDDAEDVRDRLDQQG
ncbi:hypothetical protein ACF068_14620 [Streptomyces sp. NPDC016309]|uniref:hypothetical protein n=1 Tax=Streptomyces sp. NPDC016309 TaxID=3364965 RepID=UPI0036F7A373